MAPLTLRDTPTITSTANQRSYICTLLRRLELPTRRFVLMHRIPFVKARLGEPPLDTDIDTFLCSLSQSQASHLILVLEREIGQEDDDAS